MINVTVVGGPHDGAEIETEGDRVHIVIQIDPTQHWTERGYEIGPTINEVLLPVHLTRDGWRAYWSERS